MLCCFVTCWCAIYSTVFREDRFKMNRINMESITRKVWASGSFRNVNIYRNFEIWSVLTVRELLRETLVTLQHYCFKTAYEKDPLVISAIWGGKNYDARRKELTYRHEKAGVMNQLSNKLFMLKMFIYISCVCLCVCTCRCTWAFVAVSGHMCINKFVSMIVFVVVDVCVFFFV